jgi:hypothetical protein
MISVKGDMNAALRHIRFVRTEQIPYATKLAIDDVLKQAGPAVKAHMAGVLDRPTAWTLNSFRVLKWAKKKDPTGVIGFKDMGYKGGPSGKAGSAAGMYLQPLMGGAPRPAKRLESLLRARGLLGSNEFIVPSSAQRLDAFGNVSRGVLQKIIANLQASFDPLNRTPSGGARGGKKKAEYYFTRRGIRGQTITAIWHRLPGGHAFPAFIVVSGAPKYKKQLSIDKTVETSVRKNFQAAFARAYAQAASTAR